MTAILLFLCSFAACKKANTSDDSDMIPANSTIVYPSDLKHRTQGRELYV
jgi:hypothetical protein